MLLFSLGPHRRQCKIRARVLVGPRFRISSLYILYYNLFALGPGFGRSAIVGLRTSVHVHLLGRLDKWVVANLPVGLFRFCLLSEFWLFAVSTFAF